MHKQTKTELLLYRSITSDFLYYLNYINLLEGEDDDDAQIHTMHD